MKNHESKIADYIAKNLTVEEIKKFSDLINESLDREEEIKIATEKSLQALQRWQEIWIIFSDDLIELKKELEKWKDMQKPSKN